MLVIESCASFSMGCFDLSFSGSKDAQQPIKLWDPKSGQSLATLYVHKNTCTDVAWNANGNWFLTASRDHQIKLFDVRNMRREVQIYRGHRKDVMRVAWHPHHESLFASGGADGAIMYWMVGAEMEVRRFSVGRGILNDCETFAEL